MVDNLADLEAQVKENTSVTASAAALIQGFAARLADAGTDPAKLDALKADLAASDKALADAVAANTPAAPPPAPGTPGAPPSGVGQATPSLDPTPTPQPEPAATVSGA